jgi:hypothetical protein
VSRADRKGLLAASLSNLTIGVAESIKGRKASLRDTFTGEWEQQVHVPLTGVAQNTWGYADAKVVFDIPLMDAQSQRMVPFTTPHFTHGIELKQTGPTLLLINAHVLKWTVNEYGWTCGATIRFSVQAPLLTGTNTSAYSAIAHLSFQGYGCIPEEDEFSS